MFAVGLLFDQPSLASLSQMVVSWYAMTLSPLLVLRVCLVRDVLLQAAGGRSHMHALGVCSKQVDRLVTQTQGKVGDCCASFNPARARVRRPQKMPRQPK